jgi:tRNA A37 threonylcarbamoyladenosine dehydratase
MLIAAPSLDSLKNAHVTIVGLGAVGSFALEALARSGIGRLRLVDFDVMRPSNSNRQILALSKTFGRKKIDVTKKRVLSINPECRVDTIESFFNPESFAEVFSGSSKKPITKQPA